MVSWHNDCYDCCGSRREINLEKRGEIQKNVTDDFIHNPWNILELKLLD